MYADSILAIR